MYSLVGIDETLAFGEVSGHVAEQGWSGLPWQKEAPFTQGLDSRRANVDGCGLEIRADEEGKDYLGRFGLHSDQQGCQVEAVAALTALVGPEHLVSVRCSVGRFLAEAPKRVFSRRISV